MRREKDDADQTRNAILNAALHVFSERGITAATLEGISRTAGLTRGAFYWHFKDKNDLLRALVERFAYSQRDLITAAAEAGHDDPLGLLLTAGTEVLALFEADEHRQQLFRIMTSITPDSEVAEWVHQTDCDVFFIIARLTTHAQERGLLTDEFTPQEAAGIIMITMNGLLSEWLRSGKTFSLTDFGGRVIRRNLESLQKDPDR